MGVQESSVEITRTVIANWTALIRMADFLGDLIAEQAIEMRDLRVAEATFRWSQAT